MLNISVLFNTETLRREGCQKQTWNLKPRMGFVYLGTGNQHTAFCTPAPRGKPFHGGTKRNASVHGSLDLEVLFVFFLMSSVTGLSPVSGALSTLPLAQIIHGRFQNIHQVATKHTLWAAWSCGQLGNTLCSMWTHREFWLFSACKTRPPWPQAG